MKKTIKQIALQRPLAYPNYPYGSELQRNRSEKINKREEIIREYYNPANPRVSTEIGNAIADCLGYY